MYHWYTNGFQNPSYPPNPKIKKKINHKSCVLKDLVQWSRNIIYPSNSLRVWRWYLSLSTHFNLFILILPGWWLSHVGKSARRRLAIFSLSFWFDWFVGSRHLVIYWRLLGNPGTSLIRDSRVRNWLWLGKVLAPLTHPTWGKLLRVFDVLKKF